MVKHKNNPKMQLALARHAAVSFVDQLRSENTTLGQALVLASQRCWGGCSYALATIEAWYYRYKSNGFGALEPQQRKDRGTIKALSFEAREHLLKARREHPELTIKALVKHLIRQGLLEKDCCSLSSIYRFLAREGLDQASIKAGVAKLGGPTKCFEHHYANDLWMTDMSHGPWIKTNTGKKIGTRLFAFIDDSTRLVPHAQYYCSEKLECFLDTFKQALLRRGICKKLYTDRGKIFTSNHLKLICANLDINLTHAKPYHAWSKGKIERFFRTAQCDFEMPLALEPVHSLDDLNQAFWHWLETDYHQRIHSALDGQTPAQCFQNRSDNIRAITDRNDLDRHFLQQIDRRVRKDCTITIQGTVWEVPTHLRAMNVQVHYDPFNFSCVEVWHKGHLVGQATLCDKNVNAVTYDQRRDLYDYNR